jgi:prophage regulatory protein
MILKMLERTVVLEKTAVAKTTNQTQINQGLMTPPVLVGARRVAWPEHEIDEILKARIAGKSEIEIKALVTKLVAQRGEFA